jgi:hypothetical protein
VTSSPPGVTITQTPALVAEADSPPLRVPTDPAEVLEVPLSRVRLVVVMPSRCKSPRGWRGRARTCNLLIHSRRPCVARGPGMTLQVWFCPLRNGIYCRR